MILCFDLDDTLYEELSFVRSGFQAVADYLSQNFKIPTEESLDLMINKEKEGRGQVFDELLKDFGFYTKQRVRKCLSVYRKHSPNICLYSDADRCLKRFKDYPIYIVTDGNKLVQHNKLKVLGLYNRAKFCYKTHCYGIKNAKPSTYCFLKICEKENAKPENLVYIGDNPNKDFVEIKKIGCKTIRVKRGIYKDKTVSEDFDAECSINSLEELDENLIKKIFKEYCNVK